MCTTCNGSGTYKTEVHWSDGVGLAEARCPECNPEPAGEITQAEYAAAAASSLRKIVNKRNSK